MDILFFLTLALLFYFNNDVKNRIFFFFQLLFQCNNISQTTFHLKIFIFIVTFQTAENSQRSVLKQKINQKC
jgi:hypothetical protein